MIVLKLKSSIEDRSVICGCHARPSAESFKCNFCFVLFAALYFVSFCFAAYCTLNLHIFQIHLNKYQLYSS